MRGAGRRRGLRSSSLSRSRGCPFAYLSSPPRRGPASPRLGSRNRTALPPPAAGLCPLQQPGPCTLPRLRPSHLARSKGLLFRGGRVQPLIQIKEPQCPAEPFLGEQGKGEGGWGLLNIISDFPGRGPCVGAVTERM